ncbi:uncharacterized protein LOC119597015 [Penaeus monodon]|uniref:uncharacterized protein LOC119597015 n=1 Tax=Penaeus monodon TaxID=6687 RepID=UPI0018A75A3E|nr:uncharacterized protein LOC119597015 [Penaeus monodon]XP_037802374.1 uncharacterized protein LOC119597015 [Penaeus monodon]XP_037802375.1 uncharacterized protein LOC119597015 [Penaeus monodon]
MEKTSEEKWELLSGLYQHGSNVEALAKTLPTWTRSELSMIIQRYRLKAQKQREKKSEGETDLEKWFDFSMDLHELQGTTNKTRGQRGRQALTHIPQDHAPLLSKVMMYSACFEEHWKGTKPEDPNYSEIYRYLSQLLSGNEPTHLSPGSAAKVLEMLKRIKQVTSEESVAPYLHYLQQLPVPSMKSSSQKGGQKKSTQKQKNIESPLPNCPLFQDTDDYLNFKELEPKDPYYEVKREEVVKKLETLQQESAALLQNVPGLNPMEIPAEMMLKPPFTT